MHQMNHASVQAPRYASRLEASGGDPLGLNIADLSGMRALDQDVRSRDSAKALAGVHVRFRV